MANERIPKRYLQREKEYPRKKERVDGRIGAEE